MKLYIAEKPSLGRAIAAVLPKPHKKEDGFIRLGNGDCVSWCVGHLLEQVEPDAYDPKYKQWRLEHLPILPEKWQLRPKSKTKKQLGVLKKLIKEADQLVHAGDPDREGQLLVDQVIAYHKASKSKIENLKRCLISDMNPDAVKRAIDQLRDNKDFVSLSTSALARSRADWLYGINMTRAYTVQGKKVGYDGVLSVGRVQTPILGLVVRRDHEIENFVSKPFFTVRAHLKTSNNQEFVTYWKPSEACRPQMDDAGRVLVKKLAENVVIRITDKPATVTKIEEKLRKQAPPLPYNLSSLQIDAAKQYGLSAMQVLEACQNLYERHKLITYPRSDSRYLPTDHFKRANNVISAIKNNASNLLNATEGANYQLKSQAWNNGKVEAHHAIIPTERKLDLSKLNKNETSLYELIARQYLLQFYPKHEYMDTRLEVNIEGGLFAANAKAIKVMGWKSLVTRSKDEAFEEPTLPNLKKGENLHCTKGEVIEKQTQAPKYFTDASLLAAMTGIARYVSNPEVRKILRDTDGLGTEATRAGIIELLFKRGYLIRKNKLICSTPAGQGLVQSLPETATQPDMTAEWEYSLNEISARSKSYNTFMVPLTQTLSALIDQAKTNLPSALKGVSSAKPNYKKRRSTKK